MSEYSLVINGSSVSTPDTFDVINPATEEVVAKCPIAGKEQIDLAVLAAKHAFPKWSRLSADARKTYLLSVADTVEMHQAELARVLTLEQGKPLVGCGGMGSLDEITFSAAWCRMTCEFDPLQTEVLQDDADSRIELRRKPLGVVASITPWNAPLLIAIWHIIPALLTGNTVVLKPSPFTPLSTLRLVEIANTVLPPGVLNAVTGLDDIGPLVTEHEDIDKIIFTGSSATGKRIMRSASGSLKRLTLELGGNDAGIILPDINPSDIAEHVFSCAFNNSGQICASLKRLYVHDSIYTDMCSALVGLAAKHSVGNGLDDVHFGPVQNKVQQETLTRVLADAVERGAEIQIGGAPDPDQKGFFFPLTIVAEATEGMELVDKETFGPILPVIRYSDIDDAVHRANGSVNGLGGSVWSNDIQKATEIADLLECGTSWVNCHARAQPDVPFGGIKESGLGVEFGQQGLAEFTSTHVVNICKN